MFKSFQVILTAGLRIHADWMLIRMLCNYWCIIQLAHLLKWIYFFHGSLKWYKHWGQNRVDRPRPSTIRRRPSSRTLQDVFPILYPSKRPGRHASSRTLRRMPPTSVPGQWTPASPVGKGSMDQWELELSWTARQSLVDFRSVGFKPKSLLSVISDMDHWTVFKPSTSSKRKAPSPFTMCGWYFFGSLTEQCNASVAKTWCRGEGFWELIFPGDLESVGSIFWNSPAFTASSTGSISWKAIILTGFMTWTGPKQSEFPASGWNPIVHEKNLMMQCCRLSTPIPGSLFCCIFCFTCQCQWQKKHNFAFQNSSH